MEVLTKCVDFENEKFVLFKDKKAGLPSTTKTASITERSPTPNLTKTES